MRNFTDGINPSLHADPVLRHDLALIKAGLREQARAVAKIVPSVNNPTPAVALDTIEAAQTLAATRVWLTFNANGPYRAGEAVDGTRLIPSPFVITAIKLFRRVQGTSGSTTIDIRKNNTSIYTGTQSKPSVASTALTADGEIPAEPFVQAGDYISMEITAIETGNPQDLTVVIEGA